MDTPITHDEASPYAPIALRGLYFWEEAKFLAQRGWITADGRIHGELQNYIWEHLVERPLQASVRQAKAENIDPGELAGAMLPAQMELRHTVPLIGQYEKCGRQIFDFSARLVDLLQNTDLGDCTLEALHLPYDCVYLQFGKQENIKSPWESGFEYVNGAFVALAVFEETPHGPTHRLKINLTTVKENGRVAQMPGYFLDIQPKEQALPVHEAIEAALRRRVDDIKDDMSVPGLAEARIELFQESADLIRATMPLIINGMFYLESLAEIPERVPGQNTSDALRAKWDSAQPTKRHKLQAELTAQGYALVHLVGKELEPASDSTALGDTPGSRAMHWRRGFWRQQPHGPGLTLRKRRWIRPTLVSGRAPESGEVSGHVYQV